jgi:tRNA dimethylallyltransferase
MTNTNSRYKIVVLCGPTGVGKTSLSVELASRLNAEIISADSRQIYRGMDIGTAKPTKDDMRKIPHHLVDIKNPDEKYTAGNFAKDAAIVIREIYERGHIPFVVGGTGFYIKALVNGLCQIPQVPQIVREKLKNQIDSQDPTIFYKRLKQIDPVFAERIHPNDKNRIVRGLEVFEATGRPFSSFWEAHHECNLYNHFTIFLTMERRLLYDRINERVDKMISEGLREEVESLLQEGFQPRDPGMNTLGYKEMVSYLQGKISWDDTVNSIKKNMRHYAKRQFTWFKKAKINLTVDIPTIKLFDIKRRIIRFLGE